MPTLFPTKLGALAGIPAATLEQMLANSRTLKVAHDKSVIIAGQRTDDVFLSYSGHLRVTLLSPSGRERIIRDMFGGDIFGEVEAIDGLPRTSTIVAITNSVLAVVPAGTFRTAISQTPEGALWFAGLLTRKLRPLVERVFELSMLSVSARLHCELLRICMISEVINNRATIDRPPTHDTIAARVGTNREAVTRELSYLASIGLIARTARRLEILDVTRLTTMVAEHGASPVAAEIHP